ncbi:hypothetical protein AUQ39_02515 [Lacticaseibacillus casei]|uniref:Uncharacterized protein n=1 Tax=Lacticaseibacillus zeae TaxID=57037 RepID=A0A5R8LST9_LACZE|nr:hypothetical protein [Lacticaseibacillus zeae]OLS10848.1 hypothetical protein AUQ39_02515 [Lacticaseibacillus casei]QVI31206.1 hypothetical protein KG087_09760 [Lacticaseibacillus zeae]TLF40319.1 hypothetical protein FEI14_10970 [Lacticaseibacillus zeae]
MKLISSLIIALFSALLAFGFSHYQGDDRYVVLNKGKYQKDSTFAMLEFLLMGGLSIFSFLLMIIFVYETVFVEHWGIERMVLPFIAIFIIVAISAISEYKTVGQYNPYLTFLKTDAHYYRILEVSDAGYILNRVKFDKESVSISDIAMCKPINMLAEKEYRLLPIKKQSFEKMTADSFRLAFQD